MATDTDHASDLLAALGQSVKRFRRKSGLSQECAGDLAGLTEETVARIERGENTTLRTLLSVCQAIDCELQITIKRISPNDSPGYIQAPQKESHPS